MPSNIRAVEITIPDAEALADLYGIAYDLNNAKYLCDKAREFFHPRRHDVQIVDGLIAAAIIKYIRCFSTRPRTGLCPSDISALSQENQEARKFIKTLRDKHIAHPVNSFDEAYVTATVAERNGIKKPNTSNSSGPRQNFISGRIQQ